MGNHSAHSGPAVREVILNRNCTCRVEHGQRTRGCDQNNPGVLCLCKPRRFSVSSNLFLFSVLWIWLRKHDKVATIGRIFTF